MRLQLVGDDLDEAVLCESVRWICHIYIYTYILYSIKIILYYIILYYIILYYIIMYVYPHITHPYIFYVTFIICSDSDSVCFSSVLYWYPVFHHDLRGLHFLKPTKIERYILHRQFNLGTSDSHLMIFSWVSWMHSLHMNA